MTDETIRFCNEPEVTAMKRASPYLMFLGQTEEAFAFYRTVFGGDYTGVVRYRDMGMAGGDEHEGDLIAHISLPIADETVLMGSDVAGAQAESFRVGTNVEIHLTASDAAEAQRVFSALASGGTTLMPLDRTAWAELFGSCSDRYGVRWMVDYTGEVQFPTG